MSASENPASRMDWLGHSMDLQRSCDTFVEQEKRTYEGCLEVRDLPPIFHYWSQRHLRPRLLSFGLKDPHSLFTTYLEKHCRTHHNRHLRFISLGAGNGDLEIQIATHLRDLGLQNFAIDCLDLNGAMLARARVASAAAGVDRFLNPVEADLNVWNRSPNTTE